MVEFYNKLELFKGTVKEEGQMLWKTHKGRRSDVSLLNIQYNGGLAMNNDTESENSL